MADKEIDFITQRGAEREYYQVALSVHDEAILEREMRPLRSIKYLALKGEVCCSPVVVALRGLIPF